MRAAVFGSRACPEDVRELTHRRFGENAPRLPATGATWKGPGREDPCREEEGTAQKGVSWKCLAPEPTV